MAESGTYYRFEFEDVTGQKGGRSASAPASAPAVSAPQQTAAGDDGGVTAASGRAARIASAREGSAAEQSISGGLRKIADQFRDFPIIGQQAGGALRFYDKLAGLVKDATSHRIPDVAVASGNAIKATEVKIAEKAAVASKTIGQEGLRYDPVSQKMDFSRWHPARAHQQTLAQRGFAYDPVTRRIAPPPIKPTSGKVAQSAAKVIGQSANKTGLNATGMASAALAAAGPALAGFAAGVAVAAAGLALAVTAVNTFARAVSGRARELTQFSPQVARSQAMNEVADVRANLRAGRDFGLNFARFNSASEETGRAIQRITDIIENRLLTKMLPTIESIATIMSSVAESQKEIENDIDLVTKIVENLPIIGERIVNLATGLQAAAEALKAIKRQNERSKDLYQVYKEIPMPTAEDALLRGNMDEISGKRLAIKKRAVGGVAMPDGVRAPLGGGDF